MSFSHAELSVAVAWTCSAESFNFYEIGSNVVCIRTAFSRLFEAVDLHINNMCLVVLRA